MNTVSGTDFGGWNPCRPQWLLGKTGGCQVLSLTTVPWSRRLCDRVNGIVPHVASTPIYQYSPVIKSLCKFLRRFSSLSKSVSVAYFLRILTLALSLKGRTKHKPVPVTEHDFTFWIDLTYHIMNKTKGRHQNQYRMWQVYPAFP